MKIREYSCVRHSLKHTTTSSTQIKFKKNDFILSLFKINILRGRYGTRRFKCVCFSAPGRLWPCGSGDGAGRPDDDGDAEPGFAPGANDGQPRTDYDDTYWSNGSRLRLLFT